MITDAHYYYIQVNWSTTLSYLYQTRAVTGLFHVFFKNGPITASFFVHFMLDFYIVGPVTLRADSQPATMIDLFT